MRNMRECDCRLLTPLRTLLLHHIMCHIRQVTYSRYTRIIRRFSVSIIHNNHNHIRTNNNSYNMHNMHTNNSYSSTPSIIIIHRHHHCNIITRIPDNNNICIHTRIIISSSNNIRIIIIMCLINSSILAICSTRMWRIYRRNLTMSTLPRIVRTAS